MKESRSQTSRQPTPPYPIALRSWNRRKFFSRKVHRIIGLARPSNKFRVRDATWPRYSDPRTLHHRSSYILSRRWKYIQENPAVIVDPCSFPHLPPSQPRNSHLVWDERPQRKTVPGRFDRGEGGSRTTVAPADQLSGSSRGFRSLSSDTSREHVSGVLCSFTNTCATINAPSLLARLDGIANPTEETIDFLLVSIRFSNYRGTMICFFPRFLFLRDLGLAN